MNYILCSFNRVSWRNVTKKFPRKRSYVCSIVNGDPHRSNLHSQRINCIPTMHKELLEISKKNSSGNGGIDKDINRQIIDIEIGSLTDPLRRVSTKANSQRLKDETRAPVWTGHTGRLGDSLVRAGPCVRGTCSSTVWDHDDSAGDARCWWGCGWGKLSQVK